MGAEEPLADAPSQTQDPPKRSAQPAAAPSSIVLPPVDVRRKKPPLLSFLLRMETLRRGFRVISLLALDFALLRRPTATLIVGGERGWSRLRRRWRDKDPGPLRTDLEPDRRAGD